MLWDGVHWKKIRLRSGSQSPFDVRVPPGMSCCLSELVKDEVNCCRRNKPPAKATIDVDVSCQQLHYKYNLSCSSSLGTSHILEVQSIDPRGRGRKMGTVENNQSPNPSKINTR